MKTIEKNKIIKKYDSIILDVKLNPSKQTEIMGRFKDWLVNFLEEVE